MEDLIPETNTVITMTKVGYIKRMGTDNFKSQHRGGCHKHFHDIIILNGLHSLNSLASTVLAFEIIGSHTLDIANFCHGNDRIGFRNQIFHGNIKLIVSDLGSSVIAIFICNFQNFCADNCKKLFFIWKAPLQDQ